jgi:hypothetical protein
MLTTIRLVNLALAVVLIALAVTFFNSAGQDPVEQALGHTGDTHRSSRPSAGFRAGLPQLKPPVRRLDSYEVISGKDLFNPDRVGADEAEQEEESPTEQAERPEGLVLAGTILTGNGGYALMSEPTIAEGRSRRYAVGDELLGFTVKEIRQDLVVLQDEFGRDVVIKLYDPEARAQRRKREARSRRRTRRPAAGGRHALGRRNAGQARIDPRERARKALRDLLGSRGAPTTRNRGQRPWRGRRARDGGPLPFLPQEMR